MNDADPIKLSDAAAKHGWNVATLWAEHRRGNLVIFKVGRVWCTTPADMREMFRLCRENRKAPGFTSIRAEAGLSGTDRLSSARAALSQSVAKLKSNSLATLGKNMRQRQAVTR